MMHSPASGRHVLDLVSRAAVQGLTGLRFIAAFFVVVATAAVDAQPGGEIHVRSATYGENCGAPIGNATSDVQMSCNGDQKCTYTVDTVRLGDPAPGCSKAFTVEEYECGSGAPP